MTDTTNAQPLEEAPQRPPKEGGDGMATETSVGWRVFALADEAEDVGMLRTPMRFQVGRGRCGELAGRPIVERGGAAARRAGTASLHWSCWRSITVGG